MDYEDAKKIADLLDKKSVFYLITRLFGMNSLDEELKGFEEKELKDVFIVILMYNPNFVEPKNVVDPFFNFKEVEK